MIIPDQAMDARSVALHYDELDLAYRRIWGDHVHHGYWRRGDETPEQAAAEMVALVEQKLGIERGERLCDIGCGYGATAAAILARHEVSITGLTLSAAQHRVGSQRSPDFTCLLRDWLDNGLDPASFDRAYAIESSEHMVSKPRFFAEARRILRPGGRLVLCAWLEGEGVPAWQVRHLLLPICREGRLPSMGSREDYLDWASAAGFRLMDYQDISRDVRRTWSICLQRLGRRLFSDSSIRHLALSRATMSRDFLLSLPRLILALRTGAMRYGVFQWEAI